MSIEALSAARLMRALPDADRERLIAENAGKVLDLRPMLPGGARFKPRALKDDFGGAA